MIGLGDFFKRVQNSFSKEIFLRTAIIDSIKLLTGIEISVDGITIKGNVVVLKNLNQTAKSAIFIKKQAIIREIESKQNIKKIVDIR